MGMFNAEFIVLGGYSCVTYRCGDEAFKILLRILRWNSYSAPSSFRTSASMLLPCSKQATASITL
jgi:hypothetical protein